MILKIDRGQLATIDTLKSTYDFLIQPDTKTEESYPLLNPETHDLDLDLLYARCFYEVNKLCQPAEDISSSTHKSTKLLIIIENLSNLLFASSRSPRTVLEFLRKLRFLRQDLEICVGTLVNSRERTGNRFSNLVSQVLPTLTFSVNPLKTGFSSKFNGVVGVRKYQRIFQNENVHQTNTFREYHYKLEDRTIKFSPL